MLFGDAELNGQPWKPSPGKAVSCLLVYSEGSHFSSSPLPGVAVREEMKAGSSPGGWLTLPHGCGSLGRRFQPPSAGGCRCALNSQPSPSGGDHRGVIYTEIITCKCWKAKPDSTTIEPNGSLEKADSLKAESLAGFLIPFLGTT
uniref:Uncharacterized protein n=1 Tax=Myotis myotis TaxID=51298 RepID=A0A7J7ZYM6_MYOMY|nr:hypothetical protein mMyoMyo1_009717 [Myotis myotis]